MNELLVMLKMLDINYGKYNNRIFISALNNEDIVIEYLKLNNIKYTFTIGGNIMAIF